MIKFRQNCKNNFNLLITLKKFVAKGAPYDSKHKDKGYHQHDVASHTIRYVSRICKLHGFRKAGNRYY